MQVITYRNNAMRAGWNAAEKSLTSNVVEGFRFGLLHQAVLDEQVDAQPLIVTDLGVGGATHDVVYVATEGNSIYAIDASSGAILLHTNLGTPVPMSQLPGGCNNNGNNIGINSTPVIDLASQTFYVIAHVFTPRHTDLHGARSRMARPSIASPRVRAASGRPRSRQAAIFAPALAVHRTTSS